MGWSMYTARFGAIRPRDLPPIADPDGTARTLLAGLDWMHPEVVVTADTATVRLSMHAPSAEAALAHLRGSYKSALYTAEVGEVGSWPLTLLSVEAGLPASVGTVDLPEAVLAG